MYQIDIRFNDAIPMNTHFMFNGYYVSETLLSAVYSNPTSGWSQPEDEFAVLYGVGD